MNAVVHVSAPVAVLSPDWERKIIDIAKRTLDHIPACKDAEYSVEWFTDPMSPTGKAPALQLAFPRFGVTSDGRNGYPICSTRLFTMPGNALVSYDKLASFLPERIEAYFNAMAKNHGVVLDEDTEREKLVLVTA